MKAIVIERAGNVEEFKEAEVETPIVQSDQVLIEVHAVGINPVDVSIREGKMDLGLDYPAILGSDIAGVVTEVGQDVTKFAVGEAVYGNNEMTNGGEGFAEYVAVDESLLAKKPDQVTFEQAATLGIAPLTAYQLVHDTGHIQNGDHVFIKGGSGGVGTFAAQFSKIAGAHVTATTSRHEDLVQELGADKVINYEKVDPTEQIEQVDVLIVTVGEGDSYLKIVKDGGTAVTPTQKIDEEQAKARNITSKRIGYRQKAEQLELFGKLIVDNKLTPVIDEVFSFTAEGVKEAYKLSESGHAAGNIIVKVK